QSIIGTMNGGSMSRSPARRRASCSRRGCPSTPSATKPLPHTRIPPCLSLDPPICLMSGSSLGFEYERGEWAGGSVPVSHRSLPQMFPKVSSRPCGFVLEQERIGQDNTVLGGLSTACQSREKS